MKRKIAGLLVICLLMLTLFANVALAATSAEFTVTQSPDNMTGAGVLAVVIKVGNSSASTTIAGMTMTGDKSAYYRRYRAGRVQKGNDVDRCSGFGADYAALVRIQLD